MVSPKRMLAILAATALFTGPMTLAQDLPADIDPETILDEASLENMDKVETQRAATSIHPVFRDLRGLEVAASTQETHELRDFVLQDYRPSVQASVAVVIDHTLDQHSVAGLYHLSCAMDQTELFDHYDHALRWLMRREFAAGAARG